MKAITGWKDLLQRFGASICVVVMILFWCLIGAGCMTIRDVKVSITVPDGAVLTAGEKGLPIPISINIGNKTIETARDAQATIPLSALGL